MQIRQAYLIGRIWISYRPEEPALILGVKLVSPDGHDERPCLHVQFADGVEDFIPLSDVSRGAYAIIPKPVDVPSER